MSLLCTNRPLDINVAVQHKLRGAKTSLPRHAFDLSTSKWDHGSPVSWASFTLIFSFLYLFVFGLRSGTGQTDGQTTAINALCLRPMGAGHNERDCFASCLRLLCVKLYHYLRRLLAR